MLDEAVFTAGNLMSRDVAVVHPDTSLLDAVKPIAQRKVSGVPVVDDAGMIIGMLSEGDLMRWHEGFSEREARWLDMLAEGFELAQSFLKEIQSARYKIKTVMSPGAFTVTEDMPARQIADLMYRKGIKRVPVLRDGNLVGIVARSDLVRALALKFEEEHPAPAGAAANVDEALRRRRARTAQKGIL